MCWLWLDLKALALAWLELALAFPNLEPGQKPKIRLGLAWLWPRPGLLAYAWKYLSEKYSRMLSLTQLEMCSRRTVTKVLIKIKTQPDIPKVHKWIQAQALGFGFHKCWAGPKALPGQTSGPSLARPILAWLGPASGFRRTPVYSRNAQIPIWTGFIKFWPNSPVPIQTKIGQNAKSAQTFIQTRGGGDEKSLSHLSGQKAGLAKRYWPPFERGLGLMYYFVLDKSNHASAEKSIEDNELPFNEGNWIRQGKIYKEEKSN
ncbi:hypothetical protein CPB84DRAFT_1751879 [Gymnopilus junonius]|uniref:Uncharacterized protein n=1 Tax=Gymnopilus junonius TaxID=109634 RepID=A0A9P5TIC2_GYMJU|nr:hypothetical protein CPB84DRAFT_1751879 [Gymnopilus junonius]